MDGWEKLDPIPNMPASKSQVCSVTRALIPEIREG